MSDACTDYRDRIPEALCSQLEESEQRALEAHLMRCPACSREREQLLETTRRLRWAAAVRAPRHFFVYPERRRRPWSVAREWSWTTRLGLAVAAAAVIALVGLALADLHLTSERGVLMLSFGDAPRPRLLETYTEELTAAVESRIASREPVWIEQLRAEMTRNDSERSARDLWLVRGAMRQIEQRLEDRLTEQERDLRAQIDRHWTRFGQAVDRKRLEDLAAVQDRLDLFAAHDQVQSLQTEALKDALYRVADFSGAHEE